MACLLDSVCVQTRPSGLGTGIQNTAENSQRTVESFANLPAKSADLVRLFVEACSDLRGHCYTWEPHTVRLFPWSGTMSIHCENCESS